MPSLFDDPAFSANVFYPRKDTRPAPPGALDVLIQVESDVRLHARVHPAPEPRAALVLFHGNGEVVSDYDRHAWLFAEAGARLAVIDYRGYGRSEGTPSLRSTVFDARKALDGIAPHLTRDGRPLPILVMGRSLGSLCAAELTRSLPPVAAGFILESGFTDLLAFARRRGVHLEVMTEDDLAVLCPLRKLAASSAPLLVLHGEKDTLIVADEARAAFAASSATDKKLVIVPGLGHNTLSLHPLYWSELAAFVERATQTDQNDIILHR